MIRRALLAVALGGATLLTLAPPAHAASPSGAWSHPEADETIDGVPLAVLEDEEPLKGVADFDAGIASVSFRLTNDGGVGAADPCSAIDDVQPQAKSYDSSTHVVFSFKASFPCNHRYQVTATITPTQRPLRNDSPTDLPLWIDVAIPPLPVSELSATPVASRRAVSLRWADVEHAPDFLGFEVRRAVEDGRFTKIGTAGASATSFVDEDLPGGGGSIRYLVVPMRSGPRADSVIYADADSGDAAEVEVPAVSGEGGSSGGSGSGTGSGSGGGSGEGGGSRGNSSGIRTQLPSGDGRSVAVGTYTPPSPPTTLDTGFQDTLPFQRGGDDEEVAGDPAIVRFDDDTSDTARQTALLVAGGGVAFSWAMALRFLSRRFSGL